MEKGKNQEEEEEDDVSYSLDRIKKVKDVIWKTSWFILARSTNISTQHYCM